MGRLLAGARHRARGGRELPQPHLARTAARSLALPRHGQGGRPPRPRGARRARPSPSSATTTSMAPPRPRFSPASSPRPAADPRLYPRPDEGGLWPEPAGAAGPAGRRRAAGHHGRLRHHRLRAAGGRGRRGARGHRGRPSCGRARACPRAVAVVNPNRLDETKGHGQLAAVGVAFLLAVAVNRALAPGRLVWRGAGRARSEALARSGGAGHDLRCGAADRHQSRAGDPGAEGHGGARQYRAWRRSPMWRGSTSRPAAITRASCWARGSMPAGGWARRGWAPGSSSTEDAIEAARIRPPPGRLQRRAPPDRGAGPGRGHRAVRGTGDPGAHGARPRLRRGRGAGMPA